MEGEDLSVERILRQLSQFSSLEISILYLKCQDKKHEEIGDQLGYASSTISDYVSAIYEKLGFDPQLHWRKRLAYLREHYCQSIADIHDGRVAPRSQPEEAPPPRPAPYWIELVRQEERENQDPWEQVLHPVPPLRTVRARPRFDIFRLLEFFLVAGTCAFMCWLGVNYLLTPISLSLMQASSPTSTSAPQPLPLTGLKKPASSTSTMQPITLLPSTTTPGAPVAASSVTPDGKILYSNHFDELPNEALMSGQAVIVNGWLVAQTNIELVFGDESWTDYSVSFHPSELHCGAYWENIVVGLRYRGNRAIGVRMCDGQVAFVTNRFNNMYYDGWENIPFTVFQSIGSYEVSIQGNRVWYGQNYAEINGYPQGKAYLWIPAGKSIDDLVIKALP